MYKREKYAWLEAHKGSSNRCGGGLELSRLHLTVLVTGEYLKHAVSSWLFVA